MASNNLAQLSRKRRDQIRDDWLRSYNLRNPGAAIGPGSEPFARASTIADVLSPLYSNSVIIGNNVSSASKTGKALDDEAVARGTQRLAAVGASGAVLITASAGGTTIPFGDEIKINGLRYQCAQTRTYFTGDQCPIVGIDTGPSTNQIPGAVMTWTSARPGCSQTASVAQQADGTGLSGGRNIESDDLLNLRLRMLRANPPASGNDAQVQSIAIVTPGIGIQAVFTYPGIKGPGSSCVIFTLTPSAPGGSRIPNATQIAAVLAYLTGPFPASASFYVGTLIGDPTNISYKITWATGIPGWTDAVPWPLYASPNVRVQAATTPTATTFRIENSTAAAPQAGQTIAFYDGPNGVFRRKKILTATVVAGPAGVYDIVVDTTNGISDTSYIPVTLQPCCPWSDSLNALILPTVGQFDTLGPSEQVSTFYDPGLRQRRNPPSPQSWPSSLTNRVLTPIFALPQVQDVSLLEPTVPFAPTLGSPGVNAHILKLQYLTAFPQ